MDYRYMPFYLQGSTLSGVYYQPWGDVETKDLDYLKEMYPRTTQKMQQIIDEECDRQEYEGSMLYDQYPDKLSVINMVKRIFDILKMQVENENEQYPDDDWLQDMIHVMLLMEMYRRRTNRRKRMRRYY